MQFVQSFSLVASSMIFLYIAYYAFTHRKVPGALAFFYIIISALIWNWGSLLELSAATLDAKILWRNIEQIGVFGIPISTLYFAVVYARHTKSIKYVLAAAVPQAVSLLLIFTNELHHWMRVGYALEESALFGQCLVVQSTTLGSILVAYNFALPLISVAILLNYVRKLSPGFRKQVYIVVFSFLYTFTVAWLKTAVLEQLNIFIHISVLYTPAALLIFFSIFRHSTFSLSPIARDKVFDVINQGIVVMDEQGTVVDSNTYALDILQDYFLIRSPMGAKLRDLNTQYPAVNDLIDQAKENQLEIHAQQDAADAYITLQYYPLYHHDQKRIGSVMIINNVTVQKLFERNLKDKAEKDYLTRLLNKFGFQKALNQYLAEGYSPQYAVLMIDVDNFKKINDSFGHATGDALLRHFTQIINGIIRAEDIAGRLGGDEFVIVIPGVSKDTALQIAERIRTAVESKAAVIEGRDIRYTISTGIADSGEGDLSFDDILKTADTALYQAKNNNRNCSVVYEAQDASSNPSI